MSEPEELEMKALVVFYSRTGNTGKVAQALARELGAAAAGISEPGSRAGIFGYLGAGRDATLKRLTPIEPLAFDPAGYDLIVLGTPVWAFTMASPVRTFLTENAAKLKAVAFFCTEGGNGHDRTFRHMEELAGKKPVATLALLEKELKADFGAKVKEFAKRLATDEHR
jgi:flavodoxin